MGLSPRERSLSPPVGSTEASQSHHITDIGWRRNESWKSGLGQKHGASSCNPISATPCVGPWEVNGPSRQELHVEVDNDYVPTTAKKISSSQVFLQVWLHQSYQLQRQWGFLWRSEPPVWKEWWKVFCISHMIDFWYNLSGIDRSKLNLLTPRHFQNYLIQVGQKTSPNQFGI